MTSKANNKKRELPFKQWCHEEAARRGLAPGTVAQYVLKGRIPCALTKHSKRRWTVEVEW